jgi:hypothetical protein
MYNTRQVLESAKGNTHPSCCCSERKNGLVAATMTKKKKSSDEDSSDGGLSSDQRSVRRITFEYNECTMKKYSLSLEPVWILCMIC